MPFFKIKMPFLWHCPPSLKHLLASLTEGLYGTLGHYKGTKTLLKQLNNNRIKRKKSNWNPKIRKSGRFFQPDPESGSGRTIRQKIRQNRSLAHPHEKFVLKEYFKPITSCLGESYGAGNYKQHIIFQNVFNMKRAH